jgi:hypothetical protein
MMKPLLTRRQQASEVPFEVAAMGASVTLQHNMFHAPTEVLNAPSASVR